MCFPFPSGARLLRPTAGWVLRYRSVPARGITVVNLVDCSRLGWAPIRTLGQDCGSCQDPSPWCCRGRTRSPGTHPEERASPRPSRPASQQGYCELIWARRIRVLPSSGGTRDVMPNLQISQLLARHEGPPFPPRGPVFGQLLWNSAALLFSSSPVQHQTSKPRQAGSSGPLCHEAQA